MGEMAAIKKFTMPRGCQFVQIITAPRFKDNYELLLKWFTSNTEKFDVYYASSYSENP